MRFYKIILASFLTVTAFCSHGMSKSSMIEGEGFVYRVVDGDTYIVNVKEPKVYAALKSSARTSNEKKYFDDKYRSFKIRLGNIDTAESKHYDASRNSQKGVETSDYVKKKLNKQNIAFTCWDFGKYGRAICSVRLGGVDLGLHLIQQGFSSYYTSFGSHPYLDSEYSNASR